MDDIVHVFGERLRKARHTMQLSQAQLARLVNVRQATICDYETGRVMPDFRVVWQLSQVLNMSVGYFFPYAQCSALSEQQRASLALVEGLSGELLQQVLLLIENLIKLQNDMGQVDKLVHQPQPEAEAVLRFLQQNAAQLKWKFMHGNSGQLELFAQFVALLFVGGARGWLVDLGVENDDTAAS